MFKSKTYHPDKVTKSYVRYSKTDNKFYFCERGQEVSDIRQGIIDQFFLPYEIQEEAKRRAGVWPSYVKVDREITIKWGKVD